MLYQLRCYINVLIYNIVQKEGHFKEGGERGEEEVLV
jgi:hypothetical protein